MAKDLVRTRRYVQKFYQMRTQLQAVGLRIQTLRSNQQMAEAMRGATRVSDFFLPCIVLNTDTDMIIPVTPGNEVDEQRPQSPCHTEDHERL